MLFIGELNLLGIIVSLVANTILGGVWYTVLFGKQYAEALGRKYDSAEKPGPLFIFGPMVCGLALIIALNIISVALEVSTLMDAVSLGLILGIGLVASTSVNTAINPNIPRPLFYGLISGSFFIVSTTLISVILVLI
jgi:hypothetical protein